MHPLRIKVTHPFVPFRWRFRRFRSYLVSWRAITWTGGHVLLLYVVMLTVQNAVSANFNYSTVVCKLVGSQFLFCQLPGRPQCHMTTWPLPWQTIGLPMLLLPI